MPTSGTIYEALARLPATGGKLRYVSTTALSFKPYKGSAIKINGKFYPIPTAGIVGLANTGVFVNGVAGQNLAIGTLYYVYVFVNAGVLTADFSTTGHSTSAVAGNVGTEIKTGDETRSLIGMVCTAPSANTFVYGPTSRRVASWFNRGTVATKGSHSNGYQISTNSSYINVPGTYLVDFLNWGDEAADLAINGWQANNVVDYSRSLARLDGSIQVVPGVDNLEIHNSVNYLCNIAQSSSSFMTEGYRYLIPSAFVGGGGGLGSFYLFVSTMTRG
jgi:hypothetical protein